MPDEEWNEPEHAHASVPLAEFDPADPHVLARLAVRTPGGGYAVPDTDLIRAIRGYHTSSRPEKRDQLFTLLLERCKPMFRKMAQGLAHRPQWREDAIADMTVQLWREVLDPKETFMLQNFAYYLKCLCADNFNRLLRAEGYGYRTNEHGQVTGRPEHVPATLIDSIDQAPKSEEQESVVETLADPTNALDAHLAAIEAQRILETLPDALDRKIVYLRVFQSLQWEEIAQLCGKTERTMRTRFERARQTMQAALTEQGRGPASRGKTSEGAKSATHGKPAANSGPIALAEPPPSKRASARGKGSTR